MLAIPRDGKKSPSRDIDLMYYYPCILYMSESNSNFKFLGNKNLATQKYMTLPLVL